MESTENEAEDTGMDEMGCKSKMKQLDASGCAKEDMYKKINAEYGCGKDKFNELYASSCGGSHEDQGMREHQDALRAIRAITFN